MIKKNLSYIFILVFFSNCSENEKKVIRNNIKCVQVVDISNKQVKNARVGYSSIVMIFEKFDSTGGKIADKQDRYFSKNTDIDGKICIKEYPIINKSVSYDARAIWSFSKNGNTNTYYFKDIPNIIVLNNVDTTLKYRKTDKELGIKLKIEDFNLSEFRDQKNTNNLEITPL